MHRESATVIVPVASPFFPYIAFRYSDDDSSEIIYDGSDTHSRVEKSGSTISCRALISPFSGDNDGIL